tara:strand:+ start:540 stop:749 length:210 start_codon:yes stop_codon:yes gene_type:complete
VGNSPAPTKLDAHTVPENLPDTADIDVVCIVVADTVDVDILLALRTLVDTDVAVRLLTVKELTDVGNAV